MIFGNPWSAWPAITPIYAGEHQQQLAAKARHQAWAQQMALMGIYPGVRQEDMDAFPPWADIRCAERRAHEREAEEFMAASIASGALPDYPAWSALMAEVRL